MNINNPFVEGAPRILGVFAHPDDETFCAGGTFAKYIASGQMLSLVKKGWLVVLRAMRTWLRLRM